MQSTGCAAAVRPMSSGVMRAARAHFSSQVRITPASGQARRAPEGRVDPLAATRVPGRRPIYNCFQDVARETTWGGSVLSVLACGLHARRVDPPFGGLWCDQPAIFLLAKSRLRRFLRDPIPFPRAKSVVFARCVVGPTFHAGASVGFACCTAPALNYLVSAARRRTIGTNVSKSTGFGTCRSNPALMAAATSPFEAYPVTAMASMCRPTCNDRSFLTNE